MSHAKYVQIVDFISNLTEKYADVDTDLPIHEQHLAKLRSALQDNDYTYLVLQDGVNIEVIKVKSSNGNLSVTRGLEQTIPHTFPKGSCLMWAMTSSAVRDIVCQMDCCPE